MDTFLGRPSYQLCVFAVSWIAATIQLVAIRTSNPFYDEKLSIYVEVEKAEAVDVCYATSGIEEVDDKLIECVNCDLVRYCSNE